MVVTKLKVKTFKFFYHKFFKYDDRKINHTLNSKKKGIPIGIPLAFKASGFFTIPFNEMGDLKKNKSCPRGNR